MLRHQLLYIEDDAEIAQLCCDALSVHGYDVTVATTGMSGLREFENSDFELVLMDVGASYANYSADITRTYPVSGTFTPRQRAVYEAVLRVMKSSIARTTVGTLPRDWKRAAQEEMKN